MHSPVLSAAVENSLTAGLCHCKYTCDLLFTQVCSDPAPLHCNTGQGKMHSLLLSAALQNISILVPLHLDAYRGCDHSC